MREDTTASGYDQPRTDPIPALGDEPERRQDRTGDTPVAPAFGEPGTPVRDGRGDEPRDTDPMIAPAGTAGPADPVVTPAPEQATRPHATPEHAPEHAASEHAVPEHAAPEHAVPAQALPGHAADTTPRGTDTTPRGADATAGHAADTDDSGAALFGGGDVERFRGRWRELQADFVDDPMQAVQGADELVDEVLRSLADTVAGHKRELEAQWQGGDTGETEQLRVALRRYRTFFDQLLRT